MIELLVKHNKIREILLLSVGSFFSIALLIFRCVYLDVGTFIFLAWNLFLAAIPWIVTSFLIVFPKLQKKRFILLIFLGFWLLFFPNAPYILTDIFHLKLNFSLPIWYNFVLIFSFAWTGLMFGMFSLLDFEKILLNIFNKYFVWTVTTVILFLTSFGVYIGRYMRKNSWDILHEPLVIANEIIDRFIHPFQHPRTWGMTLILGFMLNLIFWSLKTVKSK